MTEELLKFHCYLFETFTVQLIREAPFKKIIRYSFPALSCLADVDKICG